MASVSNPGLRGACFTSLASMPRTNAGTGLAGGLPRPAVPVALAVDEGVELCALVESNPNPSSNRLHDGADVGIGGQLAGELQRDVDLRENLAEAADFGGEIDVSFRRVPVGLGLGTRGRCVAVSTAHLADGRGVLVGLVESG